jgi:hypothetical protein
MADRLLRPLFRRLYSGERVRQHRQHDMPVPARIARLSRFWSRERAQTAGVLGFGAVTRTYVSADTAPLPIIA